MQRVRVTVNGGTLMRFTLPLLAVLSIAGAVRSADPRADETGTLAQEYQKALKESGQVRPNFRRRRLTRSARNLSRPRNSSFGAS